MKEDRRIDQAGSVGVLVGFYEREREKKCDIEFLNQFLTKI